MNPFPPSELVRRKTAGFTLVELLVSCAILAIFVVMVSQMVNSTTLATKSSQRHLDADDEARTIFDRMAGDIAHILRRPDINPLFLPVNGNDSFYFYSQAPANGGGGTTNSQIALIGYQVTTNGLSRLGIAQTWDTMTFGNVSSTNTNNANWTSVNAHTIGPSVLRMEFALRMKPGSTNNTNGLPPTYTTSATTNGANVFFQTNNSGQALNDIAEIVVSLAILDQTSRQIVTGTAVTNLAAVTIMLDASLTPTGGAGLLNGTAASGIPADQWRSNALTLSGIPAPARAQVRIYQRSFPINP